MAEHLHDIRRHMSADASPYGNCAGCGGHSGNPYPAPGWKCPTCGDTNDVIRKPVRRRIAVPLSEAD